MVLDTLGGDVHVRSLAAVRPGGVVVALAAAPIPAHRPIGGVRIEKPAVVAARERLSTLFEWAAAGRIVPQVGRTYPLQDAAKAYAASEDGHARGKIVLRIA